MTQQVDPILSLPEVVALTSLSRPTIYRRMEKDAFPARVRLGPGRIGWRQSAIDAWLTSLPTA